MNSWLPILSSTVTSSGALTYAWRDESGDATDTNSYSFASQAIGAEADRDYVLVFVFGRLTGTPSATISSVTIGGVSATQRGTSTAPASDTTIVALFSAVVPSGTTATVGVTFSATMSRCVISVYTIKGNSSITPTATTANYIGSATGLNLNVATPSGNSVILAASYAAATDNTMTWTGLDKDFEAYYEGANVSSGSRAYASAGTQTVQMTFGAATHQVGLSAVFQ